jgi:hypothetical protein
MAFMTLSLRGAVSVLGRLRACDVWTIFPAFMVFYFVALYTVFFGATRFHYTFLPFLFLYSGIPLQLAWMPLRKPLGTGGRVPQRRLS